MFSAKNTEDGPADFDNNAPGNHFDQEVLYNRLGIIFQK